MLKLSKEKYNRAERFIEEEARPLEKALFEYYFRKGEIGSVVEELSKYQNEDGGFGWALESDVRLEHSNPFTTSVAFQRICELNLRGNDDIVKRGINYLLSNYIQEFNGWLLFPRSVEEAPRAIWWNYEGNEGKSYNSNPSAEIAGYLSKYSDIVPVETLKAAVEEALSFIDNHGEELNMHQLFCYQRMAACLGGSQKIWLQDKLNKLIPKVIEYDVAKWEEYVARPLSFIHSPADEVIPFIGREHIDNNLDFIISQQQENGCWKPCWSWGRYEEQWKIAEREWSGHITLDNLLVLRAFNRIEE